MIKGTVPSQESLLAQPISRVFADEGARLDGSVHCEEALATLGRRGDGGQPPGQRGGRERLRVAPAASGVAQRPRDAERARACGGERATLRQSTRKRAIEDLGRRVAKRQRAAHERAARGQAERARLPVCCELAREVERAAAARRGRGRCQHAQAAGEQEQPGHHHGHAERRASSRARVCEFERGGLASSGGLMSSAW
ncbi:hypothetical protein T492DRAFT_1060116 [Pavlovales sp. CCMP2436]|nr:hypothetical protein T492DRAFT_1060116 [Pavlovales sp. CCMP2436]